MKRALGFHVGQKRIPFDDFLRQQCKALPERQREWTALPQHDGRFVDLPEISFRSHEL